MSDSLPPGPENSTMASLIKIGHIYLNLDLVQSIEDFFPRNKEDKIVVHFNVGGGGGQTFAGRDADDLRTWLNSIAVNLHDATETEITGRPARRTGLPTPLGG